MSGGVVVVAAVRHDGQRLLVKPVVNPSFHLVLKGLKQCFCLYARWVVAGATSLLCVEMSEALFLFVCATGCH